MSWRTFKFFELEELKDPDTNEPYDKLKVRTVPVGSAQPQNAVLAYRDSLRPTSIVNTIISPQEIGVTCSSCGRGQMILGDILFHAYMQ